jgi:inosine-uridine nucleoside N-ribohydrolase
MCCHFKIPVYIGAHEGLAHKFELPPGEKPFHGENGFVDAVFDRIPTDDPDNPIVQDEHAANAINRLVNQYPGLHSEQCYQIKIGLLEGLCHLWKCYQRRS